MNSVAPLPENKWYDAGDDRFKPGNILLNARNIDTIYIIDKQTKKIVWEYVNRGGTIRPSPIPYDHTPQLRALPKPEELALTPPNNLDWHIKPDKLRKKTSINVYQQFVSTSFLLVVQDR